MLGLVKKKSNKPMKCKAIKDGHMKYRESLFSKKDKVYEITDWDSNDFAIIDETNIRHVFTNNGEFFELIEEEEEEE